MKIHEDQATEWLRAPGAPVARGHAAFGVRRAEEAAQRLGVFASATGLQAGGAPAGPGPFAGTGLRPAILLKALPSLRLMRGRCIQPMVRLNRLRTFTNRSGSAAS